MEACLPDSRLISLLETNKISLIQCFEGFYLQLNTFLIEKLIMLGSRILETGNTVTKDARSSSTGNCAK
jgi:hypothetical protein